MSDFLILDDEKKSKNDNNVNNKNNLVDKTSLLDKINDFIISFQSVKIKEKVIFYRLLSTMTNAGITLLKSIKVLEKQENNPIFKNILKEFYKELKEGKKLSQCLSMYYKSFSEAEIGIIKSGEKTGQLNSVLGDLSNQIEKIDSISGKIKSAMMYPMMIIIVVIGVVSTMMIVVVPKLLEIFEDKSDLPTSTILLIGISDIFRDYWFFVIILFIMTFIFVSIWKKTPDGLYLFDKFILKIPIFGEINKKLILSKFSRTFSQLSKSGVSVVESLKITALAVGNEVYKQRLLLLSEDISSGIKMGESMDGDELFPDMMVQMIYVGEQTAKLDGTILKVADFYEEEVDNTILILNKLLEPIIIVVLAVIVGFIAIAIMQPIMNLADTVSNG